MSGLDVRGVTKSFGGVIALDDLDLTVEDGEIVGLIGPNGSGKSTLFHCIAGALRPERGDISYRGRSLIGLAPDRVCLCGVGRTFQLARVFPTLTALENVLAGQPHHAESVLAAFAGASTRTVRQRARENLEFVGLDALGDEPAGELSYGQQRLLELAAVLTGEPRLILLDEPTAGINPALVERLLAGLREINRRGVTIILIEHNMEAVMGLSGRIYALAMGRKIAEGSPDHVRDDPAVLEAYFGAARVWGRR
jgi:ABC-type branched-subunit amino acid transport system ATPase component